RRCSWRRTTCGCRGWPSLPCGTCPPAPSSPTTTATCPIQLKESKWLVDVGHQTAEGACTRTKQNYYD
ncbi:unnamed protein product, partial [Heterosigma akashiwo]